MADNQIPGGSTPPDNQKPPPQEPVPPPATPTPQPPRPSQPPPTQFSPPPVQVPPQAATAGPETTQAKKPRRTACIVVLIVLLCFAVFGVAMFVLAAALGSSGGAAAGGWGTSFGDKVGVIHISGIISSGSGASLFGGHLGAETLMKLIRKAGKEQSVKAVVLRINSPGGSAAASQEIYQEVLRLREKKPVVVSMGDMAASGGYYVAAAGSKIMACSATMTGSIGVIMPTLQYYEALKKIGVSMEPIKSGAHKDIGSGARPMTPEERKLLQDMVMDVYDQFVSDVASARKMDPAKVKKIADGRILTGRQAKDAGLVDEIGNYRDALKLAAKLGGIKGEEFTIREYGKVTLFEALSGSYDTVGGDQLLRRALQSLMWESSTHLLMAPQVCPGTDLSSHAP